MNLISSFLILSDLTASPYNNLPDTVRSIAVNQLYVVRYITKFLLI